MPPLRAAADDATAIAPLIDAAIRATAESGALWALNEQYPIAMRYSIDDLRRVRHIFLRTNGMIA
ncbi:hypothetical protein [Sandarakinorhabdus sp.]|jgi:hypothetical protein|uniref:hypothetical protein n=1 Tax=Sandarakinorhabdus sp. TaxID=1916663 RepID=UPI0028AD34B9|nr:hypothetical protein [Sandarakinorhabdus sp.]